MKKMIKPEVISNTPMESLEEACAYFKQVLQEHLDKNVTSHYLRLLL